MEESSRLFIFSSELFSDFSTQISLYHVSSLEDIIKIFKQNILNVLEGNNFTNLIKLLNERNLHIHGYTIEDILVSKKDTIFYICDHDQNCI